MIVELCAIDDGLTNWEMEFIDSMAKRFKADEDFDPRQVDKMYEILNDKG
jgi:hypothetical protein